MSTLPRIIYEDTRRAGLFLISPLLLCLLLVFSGCSPIAYRDNSIPPVPAGPTYSEQAAKLVELQKILHTYGTPVPMDGAPGFTVNSPDYTLSARLAGTNDLDLSVYWVPGNHSKLSLPLIIADIRSRMAETLIGEYSIQPQQ